MDFYDKMLLISKDIFKKIKSIVDENKGNDEKYYCNAYLQLSDGRKVEFSLMGYSADVRIPNYKKINGSYLLSDSFDMIENGRYGFSSHVGIFDIEGQMLLDEDKTIRCEFNEKKQFSHEEESLSKEEQEKVKLYLSRIHDLVETAVYDTDMTHRVSNLVYDEKLKYNKQLFEKEMQKLKKDNPESDILPSVKIAVDWWGNLIEYVYSRDIKMHSKHPDYFDEEDAIELDKDKLIKFKQILTKKIMDELRMGKDVRLSNDINFPITNIICDASEEAGIEKMGFWNHEMKLSPDFVWVRNGINNLSPEEKEKLGNGTLFDDPEFREYNPEESSSVKKINF